MSWSKTSVNFRHLTLAIFSSLIAGVMAQANIKQFTESKRVTGHFDRYQKNLLEHFSKTSTYSGESDKLSLIEKFKADYNASEDSVVKNPKQVIFLLHGLTGDATTFNENKMLMEARYSSHGVAVVPLTYPTGHGKPNVNHFAKIIHSKIIRFYYTHKIPNTVPFSFMAHSQGGIVSLIYGIVCVGYDYKSNLCGYKTGKKHMTERYARNDKQRNEFFPVLTKQEIAKYTPKNMVALGCFGCPFGGSARAGGYLDSYVRYLIPLPEAEMKDLATGAYDATFLHRSLAGELSDPSNPRNHFGLPANLKIFTVASVYNGMSESLWSPLTQFFSSIFYGDREFDLAVDVSSANPAFIYTKMDLASGAKETELVEKGFQRIFFNRPHFSIQTMLLRMNFGTGLVDVHTCDTIDIISGCEQLKYDPSWALTTELGFDSIVKRASLDYPGIPMNEGLQDLPEQIQLLPNSQHTSEFPLPDSSGAILPLESQLGVEKYIKEYVPKKIRNFQSEIHFVMPKGYSRLPILPNDVPDTAFLSPLTGAFSSFWNTITFNDTSENYVKIGPYDESMLAINDPIENYKMDNGFASKVHGTTNNPFNNSFTYFHKGRMREENAFKPITATGDMRPLARTLSELHTYKVKYKFRIPGWQVGEDFDVLVSPSYRSYTEVKIYPYLPLAAGSRSQIGRCVIGILGYRQKSHQNIIYKNRQPTNKSKTLLAPVELTALIEAPETTANFSKDRQLLPAFTFVKVHYRTRGRNAKSSQYQVTPLDSDVTDQIIEKWQTNTAKGWVYLTDVDILDQNLYKTTYCD